jgi:hypothetical protein
VTDVEGSCKLQDIRRPVSRSWSPHPSGSHSLRIHDEIPVSTGRDVLRLQKVAHSPTVTDTLNWVRMEAKTPLASTWPIGLQPPFFNVWKTTLVWSTVLQLVDGRMKSRCTPCVGDGDAYVEENAAEIVPGQSPFFFPTQT